MFSYDGLVLTSIDVIEAPTEGRPNRVEFPGHLAKGTSDDKTAYFLRNVKEARRENGGLVLEADKVDISNLEASRMKKPLFCIHGFNVSAEDHLMACQKAQESSEKFNPIPVIWPAKGEGRTSYFGKRKTESVGAGTALKTLTKFIGKFPKKSLHAHSMGNRVLRYAADAGFTFDNIFMVAAVSEQILFDR